MKNHSCKWILSIVAAALMAFITTAEAHATLGLLGGGSHGSWGGGSRGLGLSGGGSWGSSRGGLLGGGLLRGGSSGGSLGSNGGSRGRLFGGSHGGPIRNLLARARASHGSSGGSRGLFSSRGGSWGGSGGGSSRGLASSGGGSSYYSASVGGGSTGSVTTPAYSTVTTHSPIISNPAPFGSDVYYNAPSFPPVNSGFPIDNSFPLDSGAFPLNGGVPLDSGAFPLDSGVPLDSGAFPLDSGVPLDSGAFPLDGGTAPLDGGGLQFPSDGIISPPVPTPAPAPGGSPDPGPETTDTSLENEVAVLNLRLPKDASVFVNGRLTSTPGSFRSYVSRNLKPGKTYNYEVRAEVEREGKKLSRTKVIQLVAGNNKTFNMSFDGDQAPITSVTLFVPENAKVSLGGVETDAKGAMRYFSTTKLANGEAWEDYRVLVSVEVDGKTVQRERVINVNAGDSVNLRFDFDAEGQIASR